jgi:hypothetical protein
MNNKLILRTLNSGFPTPFQDTTLSSVLSHADLDNNFIYLKSELIYSGTTSGTILTLKKIGGVDFDVDLSGIVNAGDTYVTGATVTGDTTLILTRNDGGEVTADLGIGSPIYSQYVSVTASTPDNYIGISDSSITAYSTSVVYLLTFDETNITSATTLNIDGVGQLDLFVPTEDGLDGPVPSGFTTGVTYFMVYNGDSLQVFDTDPSSSSILYTNPAPVPTTIGGILAGSTFSGATMQQMWDSLLYPYLSPTFSSFSISGQSTILEVGDTIAAGSKTFNWGTTFSGNLVANTIKIKDNNTATIISTPTTGIANDGTEVISIAAITRTTAGLQRWIISGKTIKGATISRNFNVNWYNRVYYGTSSATTLTTNEITGLTTSVLTNTANRTHSLAAGDYKYICIPTALTNPTLFKDASTNLTVAMAGPSEGYNTLNNGYYVDQVVVTNAFGINITYNVYRTKNILGGTLSIITT